jgi:Asp-tRNA(Asn)/Glu-tRNA(Gln) amidotransferase A subunit family amidase
MVGQIPHLEKATPHMPEISSSTGRAAARGLLASAVVASLGLAFMPPSEALSNSTTDNSAAWYVNDARRPSLDTGSIRNVTGSPMEGFGNIFVHVEGTPAPRMNDQMMRGFGLTATSAGSYHSTRSVQLGSVSMTRKVQVVSASNTASFFDTFTNSSTAPVTVDVSFGGSLGYGTAATTAGTISATGSGDTKVDPADTWVTATTSGQRPTGVVVGSGVDALGEQQSDPFTTPYTQSGSKANDLGFVHELTIQPGQTESLAQYVVIGTSGDTSAIATTTADLAATPDFSNLTPDEICTIENWNISAYATACSGAQPLDLPPVAVNPVGATSVAYDVTGKTISQLQADMTSGAVTSVQITKAYLDRIAAYDDGPLGFHAFITVAKDAVAQAMAADAARKRGRTGDLLGVPIALKDLYDTKDMPTTGGTRALKDWNPGVDAWQVAKLREAGAVIIGKTNLSEFANSGSFSESGFKQTWNALYPSKTSFGSSGGSATAVATDMAAAAMGTQTGVSLYAPTTGASLSAFRGTDGLASADGVIPLTWATDYAGPIAKDVTDLASMLDATATQTTGNDPDDLLTARVDNSLRPKEWKTALKTSALQGKVIGYVPAAFASTQVTDDTAGAVALAQARAALEAAGATLVPMTASTAPAAPSTTTYPNPASGNAGAEGWERYEAKARPVAFPYTTKQLMESQQNLPYNVSANYTSQPYDDAGVDRLLARRDAYKASAATWMDTAAGQRVDAVIYPGFLTAVGNNDESSSIFSSDRASGVITQTIGLPTVILPIGRNADAQSNSVQLVGRAWDDAKVLGMGYALEQETKARQHTTFAPALSWSGPATSTTSVDLAATESTYGRPTTAAVTVAADPTASGAVSVTVAGKSVTGTLHAGTATLRLPADVGPGTHLVTAKYAGSATVAASSATALLKVVRATPTVRATLAKAKVGIDEHATIALKVGVTTNGKIQTLVYQGGRIIASDAISSSGSAKLKLPLLGKGKHRLRVRVVATDKYSSAWSKTVILTVKQATKG